MNGGDNKAFRVYPPIFKMYPEEFSKMGLSESQMQDLFFLQADLAAKIARAELEYFEGVKEVLRPGKEA